MVDNVSIAYNAYKTPKRAGRRGNAVIPALTGNEVRLMSNPSTSDRHSAYYDAMRDADEALADALSHVRAEEDARRITPVEAAAERVGLLERHLAECRRLRRELLGGS